MTKALQTFNHIFRALQTSVKKQNKTKDFIKLDLGSRNI